jgi:hypothetical protein
MDYPRCRAEIENISQKEHPHRDLSTALRSGRDDKGEGRYGPHQRSREEQTADPYAFQSR